MGTQEVDTGRLVDKDNETPGTSEVKKFYGWGGCPPGFFVGTPEFVIILYIIGKLISIARAF